MLMLYLYKFTLIHLYLSDATVVDDYVTTTISDSKAIPGTDILKSQFLEINSVRGNGLPDHYCYKNTTFIAFL